MADTFPTADQVARAIVAASKEVDADPVDVASGVQNAGGRHGRTEITRARYYAAWALREHFSGCPTPAIGRMVGSNSPDCLLANIDYQLRIKSLKWWNQGIVDRVLTAEERDREAVQEVSVPEVALEPSRPEPAPPRPAAPPPRPLTPGKRQLLDELAAAVRNTAAMQRPN